MTVTELVTEFLKITMTTTATNVTGRIRSESQVQWS